MCRLDFASGEQLEGQRGTLPIDKDFGNMPIIVADPKRGSRPSSRRPSKHSIDSGGISAISSISNTCDALGLLRHEETRNDVSLPAKRASDPTAKPNDVPHIS